MILDAILERYDDKQFEKMDGFDAAVIGVSTDTGKLVYSYRKCIEILMEQGVSEDEARDDFEYNTVRSVQYNSLVIICDDDF